MRCLIVDHYDSFTFNLVQLAASIFLETPIVIQRDTKIPKLKKILQQIDAIILSPGPGSPTVQHGTKNFLEISKTSHFRILPESKIYFVLV